MLRRILILPLLFLMLNTTAQEFLNRDSLWQVLKTAAPDSNKVTLYIQLGQQYELNNPDSALLLYELALRLSKRIGYTRGFISYYTNATYVYNLKGRYDTALALNLKSVEIAREFGDPERLAACLGNVGASYMMLDNHEKAIEYFLQITPLYEKLAIPMKVAIINDNLSVLHNTIGEYAKAVEHGQKALQIYEKMRNEYGIVSASVNLALAKSALYQRSDAIALLKRATDIATRSNNLYALTSIHLNLSDIAIDLFINDDIGENCDKALTLARKLGDSQSEAIALRGLAVYHFNKNDPAEASRYIQQSLAICKQNNYVKHLGKAYLVMANIAVLNKDFKARNTYTMKSDSIEDILFSEKTAKNIQVMEAKYEAEKKEQQIRQLEQQAEIKDLSIARSRLFNGLLIGSLLSLLVIALLSKRNYQQKKKILLQDNKVQEARIAQLENEKLILAGEAVIKGQEEERGRLAKDLHDGLGGILSGVKFSLTNMKSNVVLDPDSALQFERSLDMLNHSITELRRVAHNMMPEVLVNFGLAEAIKSYCESLREANLFQLDYQAIGMEQRLPDKTEIFIFRIVQELLNNIIKHAKAKQVLVQLARLDNELSVTVEDDGVGFDIATKSKGAGLGNIRSRVDYMKGRLDIQSSEQGTSVYITIPLA